MACWAENFQIKSRERFPDLFGLIKQDPELAPALQRQFREGVDIDSWSSLGMVSSNTQQFKNTLVTIT